MGLGLDRMFMVAKIDEAEWDYSCGSRERLPPRYRPSVLHWYREDAEREAERLVLAHGGRFAVLEIVCILEAKSLTPSPLPLQRVPVYHRMEE